MTDRIYVLSVALDKEYRDDDVEAIVNAIKMIKGVADVKLHVSNPDTYYAVIQAKLEIRNKLLDVIRDFGK